MKKVERNNEPTIFNLDDNDIEMNNAIQTAKNSITDFQNAMENSENENFALKIKFEHKNGSEFIWITNIQEFENEYYGIVNNLPNTIKYISLGEKIKIQREKISDWMYSNNGKLFGGFTIKALRNKMTLSERKNFDKEFTLKIE